MQSFMIKWKEYIEGSVEEWDSLLLEAQDYTIFQSYGWGEHKRNSGWIPRRFIAYNKGGKVVAMFQILLKKLPLGLQMGWAAGGPAFRFMADGQLQGVCDFSELFQRVKQEGSKTVWRFHSHLPHGAEWNFEWGQVCRRPLFKLNSGFTIHAEVPSEREVFLAGMTSKHRYYVKQAMKAGLRWQAGNGDREIEDMLSVHRDMVTSKNLAAIATNREEIQGLRQHLGENGLTIFTGFLGEKPVTTCLTMNFGEKAIYMVAGTNEAGRKISAAYAMVVELMEVLRGKGIRHFDFGGIDPEFASAAGVNHFKKGFGGRIVEYVGEWEWGVTPFWRVGMNLLMKAKGIGR